MSADPKFTVKQLVAIAGTLSALSSAGGAATVMAQGAVQDEKIATNAREIGELWRHMSTIADATTATRATVSSLEGDVTEIKGDTKEALRLLNQVIGRNGRQR